MLSLYKCTHDKFLDSKFSDKRSILWLALPKVGFPLVWPENTVVVMTQDEVIKQKDEFVCELHQKVEAECKAEHKVEENGHKTAELLEAEHKVKEAERKAEHKVEAECKTA